MRSVKRRALLLLYPHMCIYLFKGFRLTGGFSPNLYKGGDCVIPGLAQPSRPEVTGGTAGSVEFRTVDSLSFALFVVCVSTGSCPLPSCKPCSPSAECVPTAAWEQRSAPSSDPFANLV